LCLNGASVNNQSQVLLQAAIINFARAIANPQPPGIVQITLINPPATDNAGTLFKPADAPLAWLASPRWHHLHPRLIIGRKEKTLHMLLVTPASFEDVLVGKLLVVLVLQLTTTCDVLEILESFSGSIAMVLLFVVLGACFSQSTGLLFGSVPDTPQAVNTFSGLVSFIFISSCIFVGHLKELLGSGLFMRIVRIIPAYYIVAGAINASRNSGTPGSNLQDVASAWEQPSSCTL
jgi:hypothetical protein